MTTPALTPQVLEKLTALHADGVGDGIRAQFARNAYIRLLDQCGPALLATAQRVQELEKPPTEHDEPPWPSWFSCGDCGGWFERLSEDQPSIDADGDHLCGGCARNRHGTEGRLRARVAELEAIIDAYQGDAAAVTNALDRNDYPFHPEYPDRDEVIKRINEMANVRAALEDADRLHRAELESIDATLGPLTEATRQAQVRGLVEDKTRLNLLDRLKPNAMGGSSVTLFTWENHALTGIGTGETYREAVDNIAARQAEKETRAPIPEQTLVDGSPITPDHREIDPATGMQKAYVVLSAEERAKGFVRPVRRTYRHLTCGVVTTMAVPLAETYARDPGFYTGTYCAGCRRHRPVGADGEFVWDGTNEKVGT